MLRHEAGPNREALAPRAAGMHAKKLTGFLESRMVCEHGFEPGDPVAARAGLAVRNALNPPTERSADFFEYRFGIRHWHAADEMDVSTHRGLLILLSG
jgi:hypothetical protein